MRSLKKADHFACIGVGANDRLGHHRSTDLEAGNDVMNDWSDAERRVEKAQQFFEQRKWNEALRELRAATSINPYNAAWFFNMGLILDEMNRFDEAVDAYRSSLRIESADVQSLQHLGVDLYRTGRLDQAMDTFKRIESIEPSFEPCYCNRIILHTEAGDHDLAEEMFYTARLYKEHCPHCYYNIGCSLEMRGLYDKAIYCWTRSLDLDGAHDDVHFRIAHALWKKGDLEQSRRQFLTDLRSNPGRIHSLLDLGRLLMQMARVDEAGEKFRRAIELAPSDPGGYFHHGCWLARCGRNTDAVAALAKSLELDPTFPGVRMRLGEILHRKGDLNAARIQLRTELQLRPTDPEILLRLANLLTDTGESRAALACLKWLVSLKPDHLSGWLNLAVTQFTRGQFHEGIASCRTVLEKDPVNTLAMYNLALACEHLRRYDEALQWVRRALSVDANDLLLTRLELRLRVLRWRESMWNAVAKLLHVRRT